MSTKYTVQVLTEISSAHFLRGYVGDCARMHGHNWKILARLQCKELNEIGIAIDFKDLKSSLNEIAGILDHQNINEIPPFDKINPTAENLAKWFYDQMSTVIPNDDNTKLLSIDIWETDRSCVRYGCD